MQDDENRLWFISLFICSTFPERIWNTHDFESKSSSDPPGPHPILFFVAELLILFRKYTVETSYWSLLEPKPRTVIDAPKLKIWNVFVFVESHLSKDVY